MIFTCEHGECPELDAAFDKFGNQVDSALEELHSAVAASSNNLDANSNALAPSSAAEDSDN